MYWYATPPIFGIWQRITIHMLFSTGAELVGDRGPNAPPVHVSNLLVENLGTIDTRPGFHSIKSIFPPGYTAIRLVIDGRSQKAVKARCTIYVEDDAPAFRIGEEGVEVWTN